MAKRFVSEPIYAIDSGLPTGEPQVPAAFRWRDETLTIASVRQTRRSTKVDRGDTYVKRHWFELDIADGRVATVYYDRAAKRGEPHWWLYTISS